MNYGFGCLYGAMMSNIDLLIIGGSGFIGAKVVEAAIQADRSVAYTYSSQDIGLPAPAFCVKLSDQGSLEACVANTRPHIIMYCAVPRAGSEKNYTKL